MIFDNYIPSKEMFILSGDKEISILKTGKFEIDIYDSQAFYYVEISRESWQLMGGKSLSISDIVNTRLRINNFITLCEIKEIMTDNFGFVFYLSIYCHIDQNIAGSKFYNKNNFLKEKQNRFEILDL